MQDMYTPIEILGKGQYAVVEKVVHRTTGQVFARKSYIPAPGSDIEYIMHQFLNEIVIMRSLSEHPHIITYVDSYPISRRFSIIVQPVADSGSLAEFLDDIRRRGQCTFEEDAILAQTFGCLASGLAFIHEKTIRYKDIKPGNILIHKGVAIFTDFGVSFDAGGFDTTTVGIPSGFTRRYCAPEIVAKPPLPRNRKSDVFSLGCVYCDMLSVRYPDMLPLNVLSTCYSENIENIVSILDKHEGHGISKACCAMLSRVNEKRPTAIEVMGYVALDDHASPCLHVERTAIRK
jgi:serine/threonine protein kinase